MTAPPAVTGLLTEVTALLCQVTGGDVAQLAASSRLDGDIVLDSVELAALSALLSARYAGTDLVGYVADLELDEIISLTVGDVAAYVAGTR